MGERPMNFTEGTTNAITATYTYSYDFDGYRWLTARGWWEGLHGLVRRHDGQHVHCEIVGELDEWHGFADFLALCDDGEIIVVSGVALKNGMLADATPYWKNAK